MFEFCSDFILIKSAGSQEEGVNGTLMIQAGAGKLG